MHLTPLKLIRILAFLILMGAQALLPGACPEFVYPCDPEEDGQCCVFYGAEALYWTADQFDICYAVDGKTGEDDPVLGKGKCHFLNSDWDWGGRVWLGWNWDHGWDLRALYTYFNENTGSDSHSHPREVNLRPSLLHPATPQRLAETASANTNIHYQTLDILCSKILTFCRNTLVLRPYFGGRGLLLEHTLDVVYSGGDFTSDEEDPQPGQVKWWADSKAGGLTAGLEMECLMRSGFGIFGGFSGSVLAAQVKTKHDQRTLDAEGFIESRQVYLREEQWISLPGLALNAGLCWNWCCQECFFFNCKLGYEFNQWFNVRQLRKYHGGNEGVCSKNGSGNLCLHGLTFSVEIYF